MSRAAGGTYTLPTGNPVISGTDITVTWGNTTMNDIATEMTDSLSRSGKGGMSAALQLADGTVTSPGLTFVSDANSGLYRIAADNIGMSVGGVKIVDYANGAFSFVDTAVTASVGPIFSIFRDSASPADADFIGDLRFDGEDSAGNKTTYSSISSQIDDVTDGTEDGTLLVKTMTAGTLTTQLDVSSAAVVVTPPTTLTGAVTATGGITSGGDILSDTDSTDSIGSTTVRWLKGWFDTLTAGTLTIGGGTITDSSGAISFGNENLVTTGTLGSGALTATTGNFTGAFTSLGIDDNATSTQLTISDTTSTFAYDATIGGSVNTGETGTLSLNGTTGSARYANITKTYDSPFALKINASLNTSKVPFEIWGSTLVKYLGFDTSENATFAGSLSSGDITIAVDDTPTINFKKASTADVLSNINVTTDAGSGGKLEIQTKRNGNTLLTALTLDDDQNATFAGKTLTNGNAFFGDSNTGMATPSSTVFGIAALKLAADKFAIYSAQAGSANTPHYNFINANGTVGSIKTNGSATTFNTSSDPRLKTDFETISSQSAYDLIEQAHDEGIIGEFAFKTDPTTKVWGYNAHKALDLQPGFGGTEGEGPRELELNEVFEEATYETVEIEVTPAVLDEEGVEITPAVMGTEQRELTPEKFVTPAGIDQSKRVPMLEAAIYQLIQDNKALTLRLEALENV